MSSSLSEFGSSFLSTLPSPSVSLKTFTFTSLTTSVSPSWFTLTSKVISLSSSVSPQSLISGVPTTFPSAFTLKPFFGVELIVAPDLFVVTTVSLSYDFFSIAFFVGVATVTSNGLPTCVSANSLVSVVVPLVTCAVIDDSSFTCVAVNVTFPVASTGIVESELVHVPFVALVSVNVLDVPSSALYEIVAVPSPVNSGVISTLPFSFALITGFLGATLSVTSTFSLEPSL